jgi:hypothetical protein
MFTNPTTETRLVNLSVTDSPTVPLGDVQFARYGHTIAVRIGDQLLFGTTVEAHTFLADGGSSHCLPDGWDIVEGWCMKADQKRHRR